MSEEFPTPEEIGRVMQAVEPSAAKTKSGLTAIDLSDLADAKAMLDRWAVKIEAVLDDNGDPLTDVIDAIDRLLAEDVI